MYRFMRLSLQSQSEFYVSDYISIQSILLLTLNLYLCVYLKYLIGL